MSYSLAQVSISHVANVDTVKAQAEALARIGLPMRQGGSLEAMRNQHDKIMADLKTQVANIEDRRTKAEAYLNTVYPCEG